VQATAPIMPALEDDLPDVRNHLLVQNPEPQEGLRLNLRY
jgi:hypothetical protein